MHTNDLNGSRKMVYVNDDVPPETTDLMRIACESRAIEFVELHAPSFDFRPELQMEKGDLLFRPAISSDSIRVEQFLFSEGVATLYQPPDSIFFQYSLATIIHQRAGLPVPRTFYCANSDRRLIRWFLDQLGGFPVVVKLPGYSRGIGVIRVDSLPALFSLLDYLIAIGARPSLCAYVPEAVHWRLTVVGDRVVSAYKNRMEEDDFRTYASEELDDYIGETPPGMNDLAMRAVEVLRVEFGGVDILAHESGRLYLLEANFPAYFAKAQQVGGVDIAGAIVEHLVVKSDALLGR